MNIEILVYRACKLNAPVLSEAVGACAQDTSSTILMLLEKKYGPTKLKFFIDAEGGATVCREIMRVIAKDAGHPSAGLVYADVLEPRQVQMEDGALYGEMERLGIEIDPATIEWMMGYTISGNKGN